tara:strand:- start:117572 stop:117751 length:180 start_codon:yes stop_codon:yes gene_type:complete
MSIQNQINCITAQLRQERETRNKLSDSSLCDGRKEQIIEKRKSEVRRRHGLSMDDNIKI